MNNDLISRSALLEKISRMCDYCQDHGWEKEMSALFQVGDAVIDCPTVDAVEVVRCKDCKHYHEEQGWCDEHSSFIDDRGVKCHPWESNDWRMFKEDDFCSYGERRADDGE